MNIKSLLIGSAAAMVAVSGAKAADAVVVEPEPVEYVRVCDAYGAGFFFIPGTETCLRFSGYIRTSVRIFDEINGVDATALTRDNWVTRTRFDVDTRNETDWGTLRGFFRLQANGVNGDGGNTGQIELDNAFILFNGFRVGLASSLMGGNNWVTDAKENIVAGTYGSATHHVADYSWEVGDFVVSLGVENHSETGAEESINFIGKVEYAADWGTLGFVGAHHDATAAGMAAGVGDGEAYKVYATLDLSEFVPGGVFGGYYGWEDEDTNGLNTAYFGVDSTWGLGFQMNPTDNTQFYVNYNSTDDDTVTTEVENRYVVGLNWFPVENLKIYGEYGHQETQAGLDTTGFEFGIRRSF